MDGQAIFDRVATHLAKQGHRAFSDYGECVYLAPNGDRCAAGCLISKWQYRQKMEGHRFGDVLMNDIKWPARLLPHKDMIQSLQRVHDEPASWNNPEQMAFELAAVGAKFGISSAILGALDWSAVGSSQ